MKKSSSNEASWLNEEDDVKEKPGTTNATSWLNEEDDVKEKPRTTVKRFASAGKNYLGFLGEVAALPFDAVRLPFVVAGTAINAIRGNDNERNKEKLTAIGKRIFSAALTLAAPVTAVVSGIGAAMGNEKAKEEFGKSRARLAAFATIGAAALTGGVAFAPAAIVGVAAAVPFAGPVVAAGITAASAAMAPAVAAVAPVISAVAAMSTTALVSAIAVGATAGAAVGTAIGKTAEFVKNKLSPSKSNSADLPVAQVIFSVNNRAQPTRANPKINNPLTQSMMSTTPVEMGRSGSFSPTSTSVGQVAGQGGHGLGGRK